MSILGYNIVIFNFFSFQMTFNRSYSCIDYVWLCIYTGCRRSLIYPPIIKDFLNVYHFICFFQQFKKQIIILCTFTFLAKAAHIFKHFSLESCQMTYKIIISKCFPRKIRFKVYTLYSVRCPVKRKFIGINKFRIFFFYCLHYIIQR